MDRGLSGAGSRRSVPTTLIRLPVGVITPPGAVSLRA
jgi:hypothetical protein